MADETESALCGRRVPGNLNRMDLHVSLLDAIDEPLSSHAESGEHRPNGCCHYHRHVADGCCHCDRLNRPGGGS